MYFLRVKLSGDFSDALHLESYSLLKDRTTSFYELYPYHSIELVVIFVYGQDFTRHMNILLIPESIQLLAGLIMLFICLAAIVLCIIRRKLELQRNGFVSSFVDTLIPFIGGGNLRIEHKWEKWFFGILIIGAFFITSLFAGDFLDCVYLILSQKITRFEQLAQINSTAVFNPSLNANLRDIRSMLR